MPSLKYQRMIVAGLNDSLSAIETLLAHAGKAVALLDRLDQATLAKAFRGELVA